MQVVEERIYDRHVLKLLSAMLRAGVMEDGVVRSAVTGTPQGGVVSPLLCNVYLNRLDRQWNAKGVGKLVRYAAGVVSVADKAHQECVRYELGRRAKANRR
jgi:retron-type reverse transcriptase